MFDFNWDDLSDDPYDSVLPMSLSASTTTTASPAAFAAVLPKLPIAPVQFRLDSLCSWADDQDQEVTRDQDSGNDRQPPALTLESLFRCALFFDSPELNFFKSP